MSVKFLRCFLFPICMLIAITLFVGCKKNVDNPANNAMPTNFSQVFEQFWNSMNTNYAYWDIDTTNWDAVYTKYHPIFAQLNLQDNNDLQKSVDYFKQMTAGLVDSHYSISFLPNSIASQDVFPAESRKEKASGFHSPFLYLSIDSAYFDKGYSYGEYVTTGNERMYAICASIQNKILYFGCSKFALQEAYSSTTSNGVKTTLQYFFNQLQNLPQNIKGLVLDVRNNPGGNLVDLDFLVGRLITQPLRFGYTHYKSGNGRLDFTPWVDATVQPQPTGKALGVPILLLADNYSISLAEAVTMAIHAMPHSTFVGETTWGATGPITNNVVYDDGQFNVPNFLSVYTSSAAFKYIDGKRYEGIGFPPDVEVPFDLGVLFSGHDTQLETAVTLVQ